MITSMDFSIYSPSSFWTLILGFTVLWAGTFSTNQIQIQRSICMPNLKSAKKALYFATPAFISVISLTILIGIITYANYYDCDPMLTGRVTRPEQILPYFVLNLFEDNPGLTGLFVACIFGSSLSTLSSGLNAMATIIWDDYGKNILRHLEPNKSVLAVKVIAVILGSLTIGSAFIAKEAGSNIVEAAVMLYGAQNGPVFGLFALGLLCPWCNAVGGALGLISGQFFSLWIIIGGVSDKRLMEKMLLPLSTDACAAQNITVYVPGAPLSFMKDYKIPDYHPTGTL